MFTRRSTLRLLALPAIALGLIPGLARAQTPEAQHSTEIMMFGQWAVVEVLLNDDPTRRTFIVDTAAGISVIDTAIAAKLGLTQAGEGTREIEGAAGGAVPSGTAALRSLAVAGIPVDGLDVVISDMRRFGTEDFRYDGILGNDALRRYAVTIDLPGRTMTLAETDSPAGFWTNCQANALSAARPAFQAGFVGVALGLPDGSNAPAIVDSGAARTVLNWHAASTVGLSKNDARVVAAPVTDGFNGPDDMSYTSDLIGGFSIAGVPLPPFKGRISDLDVFRTFGLDSQAAIILGIDLLKLRPFGIARGAAQFCI